MTVDVFSDVVCPFCYIGKRNMESALRELGIADAEIRFRSFELDPHVRDADLGSPTLGRVAWDRLNEVGFAYDWATEARQLLMDRVRSGRLDELAFYTQLGTAVQHAIPTPEHFLPLLYTLALREADEDLDVFNDYALAGSLTMTSVALGVH